MVDRVQRVGGSVYDIGPKAQPGGVLYAATLASTAALASIDAKVANCNTDAIIFASPQPVTIGAPLSVYGDMGRTWALSATGDSVAVSGAVQVPGVAQEAGGNLDAIAAQLAALNNNVLALNAATAALAQNIIAMNGNLGFVVQQLNNIGAVSGALTTTFQ